jgi:O-antigen ligase
MRYTIILFLILAPVIDFTYKLRFPLTGSLELSPNRILKALPLLFVALLIVHRPSRSFLWKKGIWLLYFALLSMILGFFTYPEQAIEGFVRFASAFIFIFIAGKILLEKDIVFIGKSIMFITIIPIVISYLQFLGIVPFTDFDYIAGLSIGRVSGGYEKQVAMMSYLIYGFSIAMFYLVTTGKLFEKSCYLFYVIISLGVVALSTHRASIIIFIIILFYFLYTYARKYMFIIPMISVFFIIKYFDFLKELFVFSAGIGRGDIGLILRGKVGFWSDYLNNFASSGILNLIFGKGHSVLDTRSATYLPFLFDEPHSDYVRILYQFGIVGFVLFVTVLSCLVKRSYNFRRKAVDSNAKLIGDLGIVIGVVLVLYSITIEPTRYPSYWWFYSTIASFILVHGGNHSESGSDN